ncbi:MAG: serine hydrolase [Alphaproteobacteria bacterium]
MASAAQMIMEPIAAYCEQQLDERYSVSLAFFRSRGRDVEDVHWYGFNEDRERPPASLLKVGIVMMAFERGAEGELDLEQRIPVPALGTTAERSLLNLFAGASSLTLVELAALALCVSDNRASDALLHRLTAERFRAWIKERYQSDIPDYVGFTDRDLVTSVPNVLASPRVFSRQLIDLVSGPTYAPILDIMGNSLSLSRLAYDLPPGLTHFNKTGTLTPSGVFNDMILLKAQDACVAATFMSHGAESKVVAEAKMRMIGRLLGGGLLQWKAT